MSPLLWAILAIAAGVAAMVWLGGRGRRTTPPLPADVELPPTPLQKASRWSVAGGVILGAAAASVVLAYGPQRVYDDDGVRMLFTLLLLAVMVVFAVLTGVVKSWEVRDDGTLDERDREILGRAPALQSAATIVTLVVWMVGLVERFHDAGAVPVVYLYLVTWTCLVMNLVGLPAGVLLGYRRR